MKIIKLFLLVFLCASLSCSKKSELSQEDKKLVETEIHQFMDTLTAGFNSVNPENVMRRFLQTDEFVLATQGQLFFDRSAYMIL